MTSEKQAAANRENAKLSTGPRTPEGKERSAANATRHGLSAAFTVLPQENLDEFQELYDNYYLEFKPSGAHESFLVEQMVHARWRIARIQRLELRLLADAAAEAAEGNAADADAAILDHMHTKRLPAYATLGFGVPKTARRRPRQPADSSRTVDAF
jgi:hypothetical protein